MVSVRTFGVMYDHTFYKQVQISRSDIRPHIKWAVSLVILHMITSIFLQALCGYMARALIRRATPFFSVTVTQQQITKAAESNIVTINRVLTRF